VPFTNAPEEAHDAENARADFAQALGRDTTSAKEDGIMLPLVYCVKTPRSNVALYRIDVVSKSYVQRAQISRNSSYSHFSPSGRELVAKSSIGSKKRAVVFSVGIGFLRRDAVSSSYCTGSLTSIGWPHSWQTNAKIVSNPGYSQAGHWASDYNIGFSNRKA
jgi:hypothetical protein